MAQLHGKQVLDSSVLLNKLSGTGIVSFTTATMSFTSGSFLRTDDANIQVGTDVVNKNYVDALASGLDPKIPVQAVAATGSITLSGVGFQIDGWTVSAGDRILVNAQAGINVATSSNGIYSATAGSWTRATDSDGNPSNEVSHGNFVFVTEGNLYLHSGWVLTTTDAANPNQILVGTNSQLWVQFSESTNIIDGDGLSYAGQTLNVNTGTGLTISSDNVAIANTTVTAGNYGTAGSVGTFTVNAQGQLVGATSVSININSGQITNFSTDVESVIFDSVNFVDGSTVDFTVLGATGVTAEVMLGSLTASRLNSQNNPNNGYVLGYTASGQFFWYDPAATGDITDVVAGNGLTGGGSVGSVTLDVNVTNGLTIIGDYVQVADTIAGSGLTFSAGVINVNTANGLTINSDNVEVADTIAGSGLTFSAGVINVNTANGLTVNNDNVEVAATIAGNGLTFSSGVINVNTANGLTINNDNVEVSSTIAGNGLTFSAGVINVADTIAGSGLTYSSGVINVNVNSDSLEITNDTLRLKDTITGNRTFSDSLTVGGNFTVNGTVSYVQTENLYIEDNIITLNATFSGSPFLDAGIEVIRGASQAAALIWDETLDLWAAGLSGSTSTIITEAGTGLTKSGNTLSINTSGFASTLAGNGLTANAGTLDVNVTNGLIIINDVVQVADTIAGNGLTYSAGVVNVNTANGLTINGDNVEVAATIAGNGLTFSSGVIDVNVTNGLTIIGDNVQVADTIAGNGLTFSSGVINVNTANGLTINGDNVEVAATIAGSGLTFSSGVIDVNVTNGLTIIGDNVQVADTIAGNGLTFSSGIIDVNAGLGLTLSSDNVQMVWGGTATGLTFSNNAISANVDGTTIVVNNSGQLSVIAGASTPKYDRFTGIATSGNNALTTATLSFTPNDYSRVQVFVNGQLQRLGDGTSSLDCYFDASVKSLTNLVAGDVLYWNGTTSGFDLQVTDTIEIIYES